MKMKNPTIRVSGGFAGGTFAAGSYLAQFEKSAASFTAKATSSKKSALEVLRREGILTARGNLAKRYETK